MQGKENTVSGGIDAYQVLEGDDSERNAALRECLRESESTEDLLQQKGEREGTMTDKPVPCILETIDSLGGYSCFCRDYDLWCPFATIDGLAKYECRSGRGLKA